MEVSKGRPHVLCAMCPRTGIAKIYSSSVTRLEIHNRMLATMALLLTFLLKCCVMTQQEGIMQDVNTVAGTDQCQLLEYGQYSYVNLSTYLYTIIRVVPVHPRATWCVTLLGTLLEHLIISKLSDGSDSYMVW